MNILARYQVLNQTLHQQQIGVTASELHGLICGILCGGNQDESWKTLIYDLTNEGMAYPSVLSQQTEEVYQETKTVLQNDEFDFQLLIPDDVITLFEQIDDLAGWVNHFLLGLGMVVPKLESVKGDVQEVITDLRGIGQLGYDENEDLEALEHAFVEVIEYVRVAALLCYNKFNNGSETDTQPTLH